jgi:hypothetical protein
VSDRRRGAWGRRYPHVVRTTLSRAEARAATGQGRLRDVARRFWPEVALLLGVLLWWPAGFWGVEPWLHLPLRAPDGDVLLLGATAAASSVSLLVRAPWPRFAIVLVFSGLGWLLSAPGSDRYPDEREVLAVLLAVAACLGILLGARGHKGPVGAATVLAVVSGLSPATWPHGLPLAVALALPFVVASWQRVAPTVLGVARILVVWLLSALLARSISHAWDLVHPATKSGSTPNEIRLVAQAGWKFMRTQWWAFTQTSLGHMVGWLWVAAVLALLIAATRAITSGARHRSPDGSSSRPGS